MAKITIDTDKDSPETIHSVIAMLQQAVSGRTVQAPAQPSPEAFQSSMPSSAPVQSNPFAMFGDKTPTAPSAAPTSNEPAWSAPQASIFNQQESASAPQPAPQQAAQSGDDIFSLFNDDQKPSLPSTDGQQFAKGSAQDLLDSSLGVSVPDYEDTKDSFTPQTLVLDEPKEPKKEAEFFRVQAYDD